MHNLKVRMTGPGEGKVFLDNFEIQGVTKVVFETEAGELNRTFLWINVDTAEIEAPADPELKARILKTIDFKNVPE